jgi:hypothetical protein
MGQQKLLDVGLFRQIQRTLKIGYDLNNKEGWV